MQAYINKNTKCNPPESGQEDIAWPAEEWADERHQPEKAQEETKSSNNVGIDESGLSTGVRAIDVV